MIWLLGAYMWLFIHRPFEVWPVWADLRAERVCMLAAVGYWAAVAPKGWVRNPLNVAFALFGAVLTLAWLTSARSDLGQATVEDWFKVALFYVLVMSTVRRPEDLRRIVLMYLCAVGLYMAHSLWEYRNGRYQYVMGTVRLLGIDLTYGDPNTFGATIIYSLPLALVVWKRLERGWQRGLLAGYVLLSTVCVLLTSSRSAFVGLCFLGGVAALVSKRRVTWLLLLALAAPVAWNYLPKDRQNRFLTLIDPSYGPANARDSAEGRGKGWRDGVRLWSENPLFGVGPGAFGYSTGTGFESHHLYGQVLGELGTCGGAMFLTMLGAFAFNALAARRLVRRRPELADGFAASVVQGTSLTVVLLLLMGLGGHNLYRYTWLWFGAFQAIALHCLNLEVQELTDADAEEQDADEAASEPEEMVGA